MSTTAPARTDLSIVPLGAGDLIDRAVRFYRRNFATFVLIAAPPVLLGTILSVSWLLLARSIFFSGGYDPLESTVYTVFTMLGSLGIWFAETVATLTVMGGAARNFVRHLLFDDPITFRETYRNVWMRLSGLIVASTLITSLLGITGIVILYMGLTVAVLVIAAISIVTISVPIVTAIFGIVAGLVVLLGTYWLFCLIAARFAFVQQVMLVEGQGVFESIGRSISLGGGTVRRFAALFAFTLIATYSALAVLYVPLGWYAWYAGIDIFPGSAELTPAWYEVATQLIWQASVIVLSPVWMVGLCLLYVDQRVRKEGYDIELMAARRLGDIPSVPTSYTNPLQPALQHPSPMSQDTSTNPRRSDSGITSLGLK